jgi:hypothetical protein
MGWLPEAPAQAAAAWPQLGATTVSPPMRSATVLHPSTNRSSEIVWRVDSRKLNGHDKQAVSPSFDLWCGESPSRATFTLMMHAKEITKGDSDKEDNLDSKLKLARTSFKKSSGYGYLQLKCQTGIAKDIPMVVKFTLSIGDGEGQDRGPRGPVTHNFAEKAVKGLPGELELWDFKGAVDTDSETVLVRLVQLPLLG